MKIALIGATGFIGSAILKEALARSHQVTALVAHPEKLMEEIKAASNLHGVASDVQESGQIDATAGGLRCRDQRLQRPCQ